MQCLVIKEFGGPNGTVFKRGQKVEADEFRLGQHLISQRYLKPLEPVLLEGTEAVDYAKGKLRKGKKDAV